MGLTVDRSTDSSRACARSGGCAIPRRARDRPRASVRSASTATASRARLLDRVLDAAAPRERPVETTRAAGRSSGSNREHRSPRRSPRPCAPRRRPRLRVVRRRVTGTAPRKWSAWVVPRHGRSRRGLRPGGGGGRVGVNDAADAGEASVEDEVGWGVGGRPELALRGTLRSRGRRIRSRRVEIAYGTPLGLIAIRPDARSTALALPNVRVTSPRLDGDSHGSRPASSCLAQRRVASSVQLGAHVAEPGLRADRDEFDAGDLGEVAIASSPSAAVKTE